MPELRSRSSIASFPAIERPACPKCQAQMMLARIVPAFRGTDLHTFECAECDCVLETLEVCEILRGASGFGTYPQGVRSSN
jgi:hypothetical protein